MTWQQEGNGGWAVATICFFLLEWWSTAGATILSERVGGPEIRQLERTDLHELPDIWVVWTEKKVQALRCEEKLRGRPFHAQSTLRERLDTSQARRHITGLPSSYNKSRRSCNLFVDTIKYARISTSRQALCRLLWSRGGHEADQTRGERALSNLHTDVPASEASRKLLEQQLTELKTQQRAQQPLRKELESARGAMQRAQRREEEARGAFTLAQSVKEQADQEASKIQSELCTLEQETHNAATEASGTRPRPLLRHHRQYHLRMAPSWCTNRATRSSQTSRVHTHQLLAWPVFSSWDSDRRSGRPGHGIRWVRRGVQANALESIAGRRVGQISKEAHDLQSARKQRKNSPQACPLEIPLWRDKECRASSTA